MRGLKLMSIRKYKYILLIGFFSIFSLLFILLRSCGMFPCHEEKKLEIMSSHKIGFLTSSHYIPPKARNVYYKYQHQLLSCSLFWKCHISHDDFIFFLTHNQWSFCKQLLPAGYVHFAGFPSPKANMNFIFATTNGIAIDREDGNYRVILNTPSRGAQAFYDIDNEIMYGYYCSN